MFRKKNIFFHRVEEDLPTSTELPALFFILLGGAVLRFFRIGAQSFWTDEVAGIIMADRSLVEVLGVTALRDLNPPLGYVVLHFWQLISHSEVWMRTLPAILGLIAIFLVFLLSKRLFSNRVGLLAALLLAFSPLAIYFSQEVRYYNLALVLACWILINLHALEKDPTNKRNEGWFILGWWLALLTHYYFFFLLFACGVYFLLANKNKPLHQKRFIWLICKTGFYYSIWWAVIFYQFKQGTFQFRPELSVSDIIFQLWAYFTYGHSDKLLTGLLILDPWSRASLIFKSAFFALTLPFVLALFANLMPGRRGSTRFVGLLIAVLLLPLAIVLSATLLGLPLFRHMYFIIFFPAFILLVARGFNLLLLRNKALGFLGIALVILLQSVSLYEYFFDSRYWREDWRGLVSHIKQNLKPTDKIITYSVDSSGALLFYGGRDFYLNNVEEILTYRSLYFVQEPKHEIDGRMNYFVKKYERFWFIRHYGAMFDPAGYTESYFNENLAPHQDLTQQFRIDSGLYLRDPVQVLKSSASSFSSRLLFGRPLERLQIAGGFSIGGGKEEWVWMAESGEVILPHPDKPSSVYVSCLLPIKHLAPPVMLEFIVNGQKIGAFTIADKEVQNITIELPADLPPADALRLEIIADKFFVPDQVSPKRSVLVHEISLIDR